MKRTSVPSNRLWSHVGYSRAVRVANLIEVSGTSSSGPGGQILHAGDMYRQAAYCLEVIRRAVEELGGRVEDIVRTRVFITDMSLWEQAGRAHGEMFGEIQPASTFVGVKDLLHPDLLIEIEATAVVDG